MKEDDIYIKALLWAYNKQEEGFVWGDMQDALSLSDQQMNRVKSFLRSNMPIKDNLVDHTYVSGEDPHLLVLTSKGLSEALKWNEASKEKKVGENDKKETARELWRRVIKRLDEVRDYKVSHDNDKLNKVAKNLRSTKRHYDSHSVEFGKSFQRSFEGLYYRGFQGSLAKGENLYELHKLVDDFKAEVGKILQEDGSDTPHPGVFIAAKNIINEGSITGPTVDITTEKYKGKGEVSAFKDRGERNTKDFSETAPGKILIGIIILVVGGLILGYLTNWFGFG